MTFNFTVSPSFPNERISDWYIFNTWLQRALSLPIHLELYDSFGAQRAAIAEGKVDIIYANPFDASLLVREKGFRAIARPQGAPDEMVVITANESPIREIPDLQPGTRVACSEDPSVNTVGRILLEPANLDTANTVEHRRETYIQVARAILRGEADVGFLPVEAFEALSSIVRRDLRVLVTSQLQVVHHVLLIGPGLIPHAEQITELLVSMHETEKGRGILEALGARAWQAVQHEDVEFMIDIISTLTQ
ncbi:phosphate/phosphite/phosphonate ABC transporter substrate-binding protein [Zoogloea sp.]|jgi:phosphonate transport system substrate-binding protein|uniref:phosphate/phosphite/phosphonate ABC transporter substrate-binding protein n=1 Tax=Zoogloea sp. TaxID=49181 RepID=UPI0035B4055D